MKFFYEKKHVWFTIVLMLINVLVTLTFLICVLKDGQCARFRLLGNEFWHFSWIFDDCNVMFLCLYHISQHRKEIPVRFLLFYWLANPTFVCLGFFHLELLLSFNFALFDQCLWSAAIMIMIQSC